MELLNNITVTEITGLITVVSPKGRAETISNRPWYGLSFCTEGKITYTHKGKTYVSDPDHAVILPQGQSYRLYGDKKGIFPVINFRCMEDLCDTVMVLPIQNTPSYIKDYEQMKALFLFEGNRTKVLSIFYDLLHRIASGGALKSGILAPAVKHLEDNYTSPNLTNTILAQQCSISEVYFRKLFYEQYNITPKQFLIEIRINKAKQLLAEGILKINAVSEQCGFSNPYHFCRVFKQKTGITPTEYMRQNRIYKI